MTITVNKGGELGRLLAAVSGEKPSKKDRDALTAYLAEYGSAELARIGDLSNAAQNAIIDTAFKNNYGFARAVYAKCNDLEQSLGYAKASPLEQLLIKQIVTCWLRVYDCELRYQMLCNDKPTITQMEHWEKRLSAAQRRYLRAVEALARVRRLLYKSENNVAFNFLLKQQLDGK